MVAWPQGGACQFVSVLAAREHIAMRSGEGELCVAVGAK